MLIVFLVSGNQYNAFSYYGKLLLGFDGIVGGSLKELNEEGLGQSLNESKTYEDGTTLTINRLMSDANQLIVYYTLRNSDGLKVEDHAPDSIDFHPTRVKGLLTDSDSTGGSSRFNENKTEYKGYHEFTPVSPFSKKLTMQFWIEFNDGTRKLENITFTYDPNKALKSNIEQTFNKDFLTDIGTLSIESIIATPTMTEIKGTFTAIEDTDHFMMVDGTLDGMELIANGIPVSSTSRQINNLLKDNKIGISLIYEELPQPLHSLEIKVKELPSYKRIERNIPLTSSKDQVFDVGGKQIRVKDLSRTSADVQLTLTYDTFEIIPKGISLGTKSGLVPVKTSKPGNYVKQSDGKSLYEKTLIFDTKEEPEYLYIEEVYFKKPYDITVQVPLE
ncbi:DUF4179 domain-containing protein [Paenibacillus herberti]|uniref:DUF4179 domain-containing protein n=1 Tax=Paenibacillus herberti TaxID=1619309 RepID=UPI00159612AC|nr:DUF4179 domain-containing protein [Paenibacillus herberti]